MPDRIKAFKYHKSIWKIVGHVSKSTLEVPHDNSRRLGYAMQSAVKLMGIIGEDILIDLEVEAAISSVLFEDGHHLNGFITYDEIYFSPEHETCHDVSPEDVMLEALLAATKLNCTLLFSITDNQTFVEIKPDSNPFEVARNYHDELNALA